MASEVFAIGYNLKQAEELMDNLNDAYKNLGIYTKEQWNTVLKALDEWVGEDEQNYENKLAERICNLYVNSYNLVNGCCKTIEGLANSWIDFQSRNTINGEAADGKAKNKINAPTIKPDDDIVKAKIKTISANDSRGLKNENSASTIKNAIDTFVAEIKKKTEGLFSDISSSKAFFGDQTQHIDKYTKDVGTAIGEVTIAIKDMYEALDTLAMSNYSTAVSDVSNQMTTASGDVEVALNDLGNSRWS